MATVQIGKTYLIPPLCVRVRFAEAYGLRLALVASDQGQCIGAVTENDSFWRVVFIEAKMSMRDAAAKLIGVASRCGDASTEAAPTPNQLNQIFAQLHGE